jgi:hypothetical protein
VVNPGAIRALEILENLQRFLKPAGPPLIFVYEEESENGHRNLPDSNCILDASKLLNAGIKLRPVQEALQKSLEGWQPAQAPILRTLA